MRVLCCWLSACCRCRLMSVIHTTATTGHSSKRLLERCNTKEGRRCKHSSHSSFVRVVFLVSWLLVYCGSSHPCAVPCAVLSLQSFPPSGSSPFGPELLCAYRRGAFPAPAASASRGQRTLLPSASVRHLPKRLCGTLFIQINLSPHSCCAAGPTFKVELLATAWRPNCGAATAGQQQHPWTGALLSEQAGFQHPQQHPHQSGVTQQNMGRRLPSPSTQGLGALLVWHAASVFRVFVFIIPLLCIQHVFTIWRQPSPATHLFLATRHARHVQMQQQQVATPWGCSVVRCSGWFAQKKLLAMYDLLFFITLLASFCISTTTSKVRVYCTKLAHVAACCVLQQACIWGAASLHAAFACQQLVVHAFSQGPGNKPPLAMQQLQLVLCACTSANKAKLV